MRPKRVILFDLDGTLTYGISTTRYLFRRAGDEAFFEFLEKEWMKDRMDHLTLAQRVTRRMTGWRVRDVEKSLHLIPKMRGIAATVKALKKKGFYVALATLGYEMCARYFQKRYGFEEVRGTTMELSRGVITGRGMRIFQEHEKALFLKRLARAHRIPLSDTVAVGDSRSDREAFRIAGFRIAVNQDGFLTPLADQELKTRDLRRVLRYL